MFFGPIFKPKKGANRLFPRILCRRGLRPGVYVFEAGVAAGGVDLEHRPKTGYNERCIWRYALHWRSFVRL